MRRAEEIKLYIKVITRKKLTYSRILASILDNFLNPIFYSVFITRSPLKFYFLTQRTELHSTAYSLKYHCNRVQFPKTSATTLAYPFS